MRSTRRSTLSLAAIAGAALLLSGCSSADSDADVDEGGVPLVSAGSLTVCTNPPYEPFEFDQDGEIVGLDIAITQEVANDLGVDLALVVTPFEGIQSGQDLNSGSCDVVASGITITEERQAKIDFSEPYFDADQGLLVPASSDLATVDDLAGARVAVQQATTGESWAQDQGLTTVQFEDLGLQVQALKTGAVDAVINDIAVLGPFLSDGFEIAATFPTGEKYGLGVKQGNTAVLEAVNGTLERIRADGTYEEIYTEWIGTAPSSE